MPDRHQMKIHLFGPQNFATPCLSPLMFLVAANVVMQNKFAIQNCLLCCCLSYGTERFFRSFQHFTRSKVKVLTPICSKGCLP